MKIKHKKFTLVELLTVILIIGVLMSMAFVGYSKIGESRKKRLAEVQVEALSNAIDDFYDEKGFWPEAYSSGEFRITSFTDYDFAFNYEKYKIDVRAGVFYDPWGQKYRYNPLWGNHYPHRNTSSFDLWSRGPDEKTSNWLSSPSNDDDDNIGNF